MATIGYIMRNFISMRHWSGLRRMHQAKYGATSIRYNSSQSVPEVPDMPPTDHKPTPYTHGPTYQDALQIRRDNLSPGLLTYYKKPVMINQGHMQYLWDVDGRRYLDMFAGIVTVSVGHCHPRLVQAATDQLNLLWHTTSIYLQPRIHEYAAKLVAKLPGKALKVCYFVNSGSEANDLAVLMARMYTGRYDVISLRNAYHGVSPYLMGLTACAAYRYDVPAGFGYHQSMNADVYRGPWGGAHCRDSPIQTQRACECTPGGPCKASGRYADQLDDLMRHSVPRPAAFIAEPIQGVGGAMQLPRGFLSKSFELVRSRGGVCIADEVQTGFGRTGDTFWGFESDGVVPDIVTMAKGIGNGFPLAAVVTSPDIAAVMGRALHFNTYGGNPVACAVGSKVLDVIEEDGTQENSKVVGNYLLGELAKLRDKYGIIGDVRGKGLMIGIEMVEDKESKVPLTVDRMAAIWEECKDMGLLIGKGGNYGSVFRMKPPMCVTVRDAEFAVRVFDHVLHKHCSL